MNQLSLFNFNIVKDDAAARPSNPLLRVPPAAAEAPEAGISQVVPQDELGRGVYTILGQEIRLYTPAPYAGPNGPVSVQPPLVRKAQAEDWNGVRQEAQALGLGKFRKAAATALFISDARFAQFEADLEAFRAEGGSGIPLIPCRGDGDEPEIEAVLAATIGLSNTLEEGTMALDADLRVVLPSVWARSMDWDCDGDPVTVVVFRRNWVRYGVVVKMPMTKLPPVLRIVSLPEQWVAGLAEEQAAEALARVPGEKFSQEAAALKTFSNPPIGPTCSRWWSVMVAHAKRHPEGLIRGIAEAVELYGELLRNDLEKRGMKAARKGDGSLRPEIFDTPVALMSALTSVFFGSKGSIHRVKSAALHMIQSLLELDPDGLWFGDPGLHEEQEEVPSGWTLKPAIGDGENLVRFLKETGRLNSCTLPWSGRPEGIPAPVALSLTHKESGSPVALTWVKDNGTSISGYATVLYPVYAYDPDAQGFRVMEPLEHMALWLSRHFQSPPISSPRYVDTMFTRMQGKARALESAIRLYVSEYGDMVPAAVEPGFEDLGYIPCRWSRYYAARCVAVDHASVPHWTKNWSVEDMLKVTKKADKAFGGIHWACAGANRAVRRHFLAKADGLPDFVRRECALPGHMHRPGRNRSLLVRSVARMRARVAVVDMGDEIQVLMGPSGIEKSQPEVPVFLPMTSPEAVEGWEPKTFVGWCGDARTVWVSPEAKRASKPIGKFTCGNGSRFEPRRMEQATDHLGRPVDILMPLKELQEKDLEGAFLSVAERGSLTLADGTVVEDAWILEWDFLRSGAASENIAPRFLKRWSLSGFVGMMLAAKLEDIGLPYTKRNKRMEQEAAALMRVAYAASNLCEGDWD